MLDFYQVRVGLSELDGLVVRGSHIVISAAMRKIILERIHDGYQGLVKCGDRASQFGWWPKMSEDIKTKVHQCELWRENRNTQRKEPLMSIELLSRL